MATANPTQTGERTQTTLPSDSWTLPPVINWRVLAGLLAFALFVSWSLQRTGVYQLPKMAIEGITEAAKPASDSDTGVALRRLLSGLFPPDLSEKTDISRVPNLDKTKLPPFAYLKDEDVTRFDLMQNKYVVEDRRTFLFEPIGYFWRNILLMLETIEIAILGTLLSIIIALPVAYFSATGYTPNRVTYAIARGISSYTRAVPQLIAALIYVYIFGLGIIPGVVTLGVGTMGFLAKFIADEIENADKGPQEALQCLGAGKLKVLRYAVLPQVMPQLLTYLQYVFERNVNSATAIGVVGAGGIGMQLKGRWDMFDFAHVSTTLIVIIATMFALERITQIVRKRLIA